LYYLFFARYSNHINDRYGSNLHNIVLKVYEATFLVNIIDIGQNLTELLQKLQGGFFIHSVFGGRLTPLIFIKHYHTL